MREYVCTFWMVVGRSTGLCVGVRFIWSGVKSVTVSLRKHMSTVVQKRI